MGVLAAEVEADLLQPVAVSQRAARDVHQVGFVRPQGHVLPRVVHGASHLQRNRQEGSGGWALCSQYDLPHVYSDHWHVRTVFFMQACGNNIQNESALVPLCL